MSLSVELKEVMYRGHCRGADRSVVLVAQIRFLRALVGTT